jgi:hypothetical protein
MEMDFDKVLTVSIATVVTTLFGGVIFGCWHDNVVLERMVANGTDPIVASCAINNSSAERKVYCMAVLTKGK